MNALLREGYQTSKLANIVKIKSRETAEQVIKDLHIHGFFLKAEKPAKSKFLNLVQEQTFEQESYYFWVYQGAQWKGILIGTGVVLVTFAGVMFPLWPALPRQGVYYLSLALLGFVGFIMLLGVVRAVLWLLLKLFLGKSGWLFPNLFADVGFIESFIPLWAQVYFSKAINSFSTDGTGKRYQARNPRKRRSRQRQSTVTWTRMKIRF